MAVGNKMAVGGLSKPSILDQPDEYQVAHYNIQPLLTVTMELNGNFLGFFLRIFL